MTTSMVTQCHCNNCGRWTDHQLLERRIVEDTGTDGATPTGFYWTDTYEALECRGCHAVCLRHHYKDPTGYESETYYPPPVSRRAPTWQWQLPEDQRELLNEIYVALHGDSRRLAMMGTRTLVDMLMLAEVGDIGSFKKKLDALRDKGVIPARSCEVLAAAMDAGSAAAHRGYKPDSGVLDAVLDIVENVLQAVHHLPHVAHELRKRTPARPTP